MDYRLYDLFLYLRDTLSQTGAAMQRDKLATFRAAIVGIVLMPLVNVAPVAKIHQMGLLPREFPFSVQTARISCVIFALLCWVSIPFINRYERVHDADRMRNNGYDPELIILLLNLVLLFGPALIVLLLSFLGLPVIDAYIYSYSIFVVMVVWLFWKRKTFWSISDNVAEPDMEPRNRNTKSYTIVLTILSILALIFFLLKIILLIHPPEGYVDSLSWNLPFALLYGFLVTSCILTIRLRQINSQHAFDMTAFMSVILLYWIPFGTAVYFYWRFKIKPRELPKNINAAPEYS